MIYLQLAPEAAAVRGGYGNERYERSGLLLKSTSHESSLQWAALLEAMLFVQHGAHEGQMSEDVLYLNRRSCRGRSHGSLCCSLETRGTMSMRECRSRKLRSR